MEHVLVELIVAGVTGVFSIVWWLLRQKDASQERQIEAQQRQIELLFRKHDDDAQRLEDLKLKIAENHYMKTELDQKIAHLDNSIREGLRDLGGKLDKLTEVLIHPRT